MKTDLFPSAPRRPRRVLMHVVDAMGCDSKTVQLECRKCGMRTDWLSFNTHSEADRQPCPVCNGAGDVEKNCESCRYTLGTRACPSAVDIRTENTPDPCPTWEPRK